jgi:hypothetical protein
MDSYMDIKSPAPLTILPSARTLILSNTFAFLPERLYNENRISPIYERRLFMKQDRFLRGILIGIGVLVVLALALFFTRPDTALTYGPEDSPEGVARNYIVAVFQRDYEKAYGYLADKKDKPTLEQFREAFLQNYVNSDNTGVDIGEAEISGDEAFVTVYVQYGSSDPFSSGYRNEERAVLVKQGGQWKIEQMPSNFWAWDWYQPTPVP